MQDKLQEVVKKLLAEGAIEYFIGYCQSSQPYRVAPCFVTKESEADKLVWGPLCGQNLSKYVLRANELEGKVGILLKGCDTRAIVELIKQHQIERDKIVTVGMPCAGQVDHRKLEKALGASLDQVTKVEDAGDAFLITVGEETRKVPKEEVLLDKCFRCKHPSAFGYDVTLGEVVPFSIEAEVGPAHRGEEGLLAQAV
jgi:coenzyme F420-reducing hydrogenase beta subunit